MILLLHPCLLVRILIWLPIAAVATLVLGWLLMKYLSWHASQSAEWP